MVSGGHSWSSVKLYTLSEIGAFLKAVYKENNKNRANALALQWMGNNLTKQELESTVSELSGKKVEVSPKKVQQEWNRLEGFIRRM